MILELVRSLTDWLNDGTNGLVAQLALIPLDGADVAPAVGMIADETRNNMVAEQRLPSTPGVAVNVQQIPLLDGEVQTITRDGVAEVLIRIGRAAADTDNATRDSSYILRAAIRSLRLYNSDTRSRNQIQIFSCTHLAIKPLWAPLDDTVVTGAVVGRWEFRDCAP